jgi:hypothetical protein
MAVTGRTMMLHAPSHPKSWYIEYIEYQHMGGVGQFYDTL